MNILGKKVILRAVEEKDLEKLRIMANDSELERLAGGNAFPISMIEQQKWVDKVKNDPNNIYLIIETEEEETVGMATIINIDWRNRRAYHGIKIGNSENRIRGIGTDTVMAVMRYAFDELQLNRLDGSIIDYNIPSEKLYCEKCGWKQEGIQRQYIFKNGKYHDLKIVGILKEEYYTLIERTKYWEMKGE